MADLPRWNAVRTVDELLEPHGGWALLPDYDVFGNECDPRDSFIAAWDAVNEPLHCTPAPTQAMALVDRWPLESERWSSPHDLDYRRLVSLCYWYARLLNDAGQFFLACRTAGELLGLSHTKAAAYLRRTCGKGEPLKLTRKGSRLDGASDYRFDLGAVKVREE